MLPPGGKWNGSRLDSSAIEAVYRHVIGIPRAMSGPVPSYHLTFRTQAKSTLKLNTALILVLLPEKSDHEDERRHIIPWKILRFSAGQSQEISIAFSNQLGVRLGSAHTQDRKEVTGGVMRALSDHQRTTLTGDKQGYYSWSEVESASGVTAKNNSGEKLDIEVGRFTNDFVFEAFECWKGMSTGETVSVHQRSRLQIFHAQRGNEKTTLQSLTQGHKMEPVEEWHLSQLKTRLEGRSVTNVFEVYEDSRNGDAFNVKLQEERRIAFDGPTISNSDHMVLSRYTATKLVSQSFEEVIPEVKQEESANNSDHED